MVERSNKPFKDCLKDVMRDAQTQNWPKLVPFVQGLMNNRKKRGYTRTPYELVYGVSKRAGYENNQLPADVMKLLLNEAGIEAALGAKDSDLSTTLACVVAAQSEPLGPQSLEDSDKIAAQYEDVPNEMDDEIAVQPAATSVDRRNKSHVPKLNNPPPPPVGVTCDDPQAVWRRYQHPVGGKQITMQPFKIQKRDSATMTKQKKAHHCLLQDYGKQFIEKNMWKEAHMIASFIGLNNRAGYKGKNMFTREVKEDVLSRLETVFLKIVPATAANIESSAASPQSTHGKGAGDKSVLENETAVQPNAKNQSARESALKRKMRLLDSDDDVDDWVSCSVLHPYHTFIER